MRAVALKTYQTFKGMIPGKYRITTGPEKGESVAEFRAVVGKEILRFKHKYMTTTGHSEYRDSRWKSWLEEVDFDPDTLTNLQKIDDDAISGVKGRQGNIELVLAIYYRFHALLDDMSFADAIDELVFGEPLRDQGGPIFIKNAKPTAPFIHPPYVQADEVRRLLENDPTHGIWLSPFNHHSIRLSGRQTEKAHLNAFMWRDERFLICPVIGPSGSGKTRLVSEWMKQYVPSETATDWDAGFVVLRDAEPWRTWSIKRDTLIVIDYTFAYDEVVKQITQRARADETGRKIRLLVIDHVFPRELFNDTFWRGLYKSRALMEGNFQELYQTLELRPEGSQSELLRDVAAAVASIGDEQIGRDHPSIKSAVAALYRMGESSAEGDSRVNPDAVRHPLFAALLGDAVRRGRDFSHWGRRDLIQYYFSNNDRLPWKTWSAAENRKGWGLAVGALVSAATLRRGLKLLPVKRLLPGEPEALIQYANRIVASEETMVLRPFEPDILGEAFTLRFLAEMENRQKDEEKQQTWHDFISMLESSDSELDSLQIAQNFLETMQHLVRNLLNDDNRTESVINAWESLDLFLLPQNFQHNSLIRPAVSICRADIVKQFHRLGENVRAARFANKIKSIELRSACRGPFFFGAAIALMHFLEWKAVHDEIGREDLATLVEASKNLRDGSENRWSALMVAAGEGCLRTAMVLHQELNESLDAVQVGGWSALEAAAQSGQAHVVDWLMRNGAKVNETSIDDGWTALMAASANGHLETARLLLREAAVNQGRPSDGRTALMAACSNGHIELARLLLHSRANVNQTKTDNGWTALMAACQRGDTEIARLLLEKGAYVNQEKTDDRWTALMLAAHYGHAGTAELLLESRASVNHQSGGANGCTSLIMACQEGNTETAVVLLKHGAEVNQAAGHDGWTALMAACMNGHTPIAELLLGNNADVNLGKTDDGWTALMAASATGQTEAARLLLMNHAKVNESTRDNGRTALMVACQEGHSAVAELLLENGAKPNLGTTDHAFTALMAACLNGRIDTVALLLQNNAEINQLDSSLRSALDHAIEEDCSEVSALLRRAGGKTGADVTRLADF